MVTARGLDDRIDADPPVDDGGAGVNDHQLVVGSDERRMHVRAYNHWVSLLRGRAYPAITDLDPASISDFGANSVLLDFAATRDDPAIRYLGATLRAECGVTSAITHVSQVPARSLLARLTDHYQQIITNRAPIGFEAEFVSQRGHNTLYRGILMPYSSDGTTIDFIYGVINWKELVDAATQAKLEREVAESRRTAPVITAAPVWADGPSAGIASDLEPAPADPQIPHDDIVVPPYGAETLAGRLLLARESAAAALAADTRSRASLHRALARAHDFACTADREPRAYGDMLSDAEIVVSPHAPMIAAAKLVFGVDHDESRLVEFAAVLSHARRHGVAEGGLEAFLNAQPGGIEAIVAAERQARSAADARRTAEALTTLRARPPLAQVTLPSSEAEFVVLIARAGKNGQLDIVARLDNDAALTELALRTAAD